MARSLAQEARLLRSQFGEWDGLRAWRTCRLEPGKAQGAPSFGVGGIWGRQLSRWKITSFGQLMAGVGGPLEG